MNKNQIHRKNNKPHLSKKYSKFIQEIQEFYKNLSVNTCGFMTMGTTSLFGLDTYIFSSMQGTLESIHDVLKKGRIGDAYALLRKYYDSVIINIYINIYLEENFNLDNFIVQKIENWRCKKEKLPSFKKMIEYILSSTKLVPIIDILVSNGQYETIRDECNNYTHYNFFENILVNDPRLNLKNREVILEDLIMGINNIFIMHFLCLFLLKPHFMMSFNYRGAYEEGIEPEENSQYWVAPFIQKIFDTKIKYLQPELAKVFAELTCMHLKF